MVTRGRGGGGGLGDVRVGLGGTGGVLAGGGGVFTGDTRAHPDELGGEPDSGRVGVS